VIHTRLDPESAPLVSECPGADGRDRDGRAHDRLAGRLRDDGAGDERLLAALRVAPLVARLGEQVRRAARQRGERTRGRERGERET
jgi:hypothetical protein